MASRTLHYEIHITDLHATEHTVEQVYPCRCGKTHRGPYALYDYGHHNCFHDSALTPLAESGDLMCPNCGKTFHVAPDLGD